MQALVSIHDVMPNTLAEVEDIVSTLPQACVGKLTLLVVPGLAWSADLVKRLNRLQTLGIHLAGHGWSHQIKHIGGVYHYFHSKCFSRLAAEHLALGRAQLKNLLEENYHWFIENRLNPPSLYVPPAWARGNLSNSDLVVSPFQVFETFMGVHNISASKFRALPLVGFEADSLYRAVFLKMWNRINVAVAGDSLPLRIAIHPHDFELNLKNDIPKIFNKVTRFVNYQDIT